MSRPKFERAQPSSVRKNREAGRQPYTRCTRTISARSEIFVPFFHSLSQVPKRSGPWMFFIGARNPYPKVEGIHTVYIW